jgi:hypothetical protein
MLYVFLKEKMRGVPVKETPLDFVDGGVIIAMNTQSDWALF